MFHCEYCGLAFSRPAQGGKDKRRFCSRACSFATQKAHARERAAAIQAERTAIRAERSIERELKRAAREALQALRQCECGAPIEKPTARFCDACIAVRIGAGVRQGYTRAREVGVTHICPNCAAAFQGYEAAVFCSARCSKRYNRQARRDTHGHRYPTAIGTLPLTERNQVASMVALVRSAQRMIDANRKALKTNEI
jgi:hypothetical protein